MTPPSEKLVQRRLGLSEDWFDIAHYAGNEQLTATAI